MMLNLCKFKVGHWDSSGASWRKSAGTLWNKNMTSSAGAGVGASELQGEHNSVLLVDSNQNARR
jgi:hypothetical protein